MQLLIRTIRLAKSTVIEQDDREFDGKQLTLGDGPDQAIQLPGAAPRHALIRLTGKSLRLECRGKATVSLGENVQKKVVLTPGDEVSIAGHKLVVSDAPPGFDAALEVRINTEGGDEAVQQITDSLRPTLPGFRPIAWTLSLLVLLFGLGLPLAGFYDANVEQTLNDYGIPHDTLWSSGPLTSAHRLPAIGDNCNVCHVEPFEMVQDSTCIGCHVDTSQHFPNAHPDVGEFNSRCASCHREHNEPSTVIVAENTLCVDCHTEPVTRSVKRTEGELSDTVILAASGFAMETHPDFRWGLLANSDQGWQVQRVKRGTPGAREASNLKFPHDLHLDPEQVTLEGTGLGMACRDCHTLSADGEHFEPITMEGSCRSCHGMEFDPDDPTRQLPHAPPAVVRKHLEEFYVKQVAQTGGEAAPAKSRARRMPGRSAPRGNARCAGSVLECGLEQAEVKLDELFDRAGCVTCHEVQQGAGGWQVERVKITGDWYTEARFDHVPHLRLGPGNSLQPVTENNTETCLSCHSAKTSSASADILIPGLDNCAECHGDNSSHADLVELNCIACHDFHRGGMPLMGARPVAEDASP